MSSEERERQAPPEERHSVDEHENQLNVNVPMPKLEERAKPKKRKVLRTRIEEAIAGKGE